MSNRTIDRELQVAMFDASVEVWRGTLGEFIDNNSESEEVLFWVDRLHRDGSVSLDWDSRLDIVR